MFRWCWWNRSPYTLLKCWAISIFAQSVLYCQDYAFNGCSGGANGCEKSAKCAGGAGKAARGMGSCSKGASGFRLCGLGEKMGSFGIFVHGFDNGGAATGGTGPSALRNSTGRGVESEIGRHQVMGRKGVILGARR